VDRAGGDAGAAAAAGGDAAVAGAADGLPGRTTTRSPVASFSIVTW
jgi:hypothetical protein